MIPYFFLAVITSLLSFPNIIFHYGLWPAAWVCAVPLFFCFDRSPGPLSRVLTGFLFGICFYALLVSWFIPYSRPGYLFFVLVLSLQPLFFAVFFQPPFEQRVLRLFYWPALWIAGEYVRQVIMRGFSWNLGCSQTFNPYILQWAGLGGSSLLSFFLVFCNTALFWAVKEKNQRTFYVRVLVAVNLLAWGGGAALYYSYPAGRAPQQALRAAVVQAAVDPSIKLDTGQVKRLVEAHVRLSYALSPDIPIDVIFWPETAVPADLREDPFLRKRVISLGRNRRAGVLTGMAWEDSAGRLFNGAVWVDPSGTVLEVYRKRYLVPFSEERPGPGRSESTSTRDGVRTRIFSQEGRGWACSR